MAGLALTLCCSVGGCYERVVKAKGLGAGGTAVQKPYASDTAIDRAVAGPVRGPADRKVKSSRWEERR
jgi:hypothetical protein